MEPGQRLYALLSVAPAVVALTGTRIYPLRLPQESVRPAITYQVVSNAQSAPLTCPANDTPRVQVSLFADTYAGVCALAAAVRAVLHGRHPGGLVVELANEIDQYSDPAACYFRTQDYELDCPRPA